jgi:hypothetical protein
MLVAAMREAGSKSGAAEKLGIPRQSLQKMIKRLGISAAETAAPGSAPTAPTGSTTRTASADPAGQAEARRDGEG